MSDLPPIFVIHLAKDEKRESFINRAYAGAQLNFSFFEAIDGHADLSVFKPFLNLIGDHFWKQGKIKPGALACFLSHFRLWCHIVENEIQGAIIAEDDSAPDLDFRKNWQELSPSFERFDLVFLNNRMSPFARTKITPIRDSMAMMREGMQAYKAPGADGYFMSQEGAQKMIAFVKQHHIIFGVDWALIAAAWDRGQVRMPELKSNPEMKCIFQMLKRSDAPLNAAVLGKPLFTLDETFTSSLQHRLSISIAVLKSQLL